MAKKIISLLSFLLLFCTSNFLNAQSASEACAKAKNTNKEQDIQKCLEDTLKDKREHLIETFKKIRKGGSSTYTAPAAGGGGGMGTSSYVPQANPAQPVTQPQTAPAPEKQPPRIHYNY